MSGPRTHQRGVRDSSSDSGLRLRLRVWWLVVIDMLMAGALTLLAVYATLATPIEVPSGTRAVLVWLLALAVGVPLGFRRRWPMPVLGIVLPAAIVAVVLGMSGQAIALPVAVALYPVALALPPRRSIVALAVAVLGITLAVVLGATVLAGHLVIAPNPDLLSSDPLSSLGFFWFSSTAGWALGHSFRARREHAVEIAEHRAREAVAQERLRIAREMHDVVAHSMSVIVMQAGVANHVYDTRPDESRAALRVIEALSRDALADIGRVVGSLRSGDGGDRAPSGDLTSSGDLTPSPGLDAVPRLVENARLAGVDVELDSADIPEPPAAVQLAAYRIVQEALTNVIKHVAPARCTVRITAESGELCLAVIDDGAPPSPIGRPGHDLIGRPGHGLIGMRERAALHHGTLLADPRPDGGFAVHARLPYQIRGSHD